MPDGHPDPTLRGRDLAGLGGMLAGAVVVGLVLGLLLDRATGDSPTWTLVGIALGILGAIVGFWAKVRSVLK
jgi:F0F1-type ATP synthase assembly protein I